MIAALFRPVVSISSLVCREGPVGVSITLSADQEVTQESLSPPPQLSTLISTAATSTSPSASTGSLASMSTGSSLISNIRNLAGQPCSTCISINSEGRQQTTVSSLDPCSCVPFAYGAIGTLGEEEREKSEENQGNMNGAETKEEEYEAGMLELQTGKNNQQILPLPTEIHEVLACSRLSEQFCEASFITLNECEKDSSFDVTTLVAHKPDASDTD